MGKTFVADFETTAYDGQERTEVWAAALVEIYTDDVEIFNSIEDFFKVLYDDAKYEDVCVYFHNLKFDGEFIVNYLLQNNYNLGLVLKEDGSEKFINNKNALKNGEFACLISDMGQWYDIKVKYKEHLITFKDSLKLIPLSVREMGKAFKTQHQKTSIEYEGRRASGEEITEQEKEYISNDVLVVKEALEYMFRTGNNKLTIGSCCMNEYKNILKDHNIDYYKRYPPLDKIKLTPEYDVETAEKYIRKSYHGGWCYVNEYKQNKVLHDGCTADVNSLYPSVMHSASGCNYPVGYPKFWRGDIPEEAQKENKYYFLRFACKFELKDGYLPFVQIKHNPLYKPEEMLKTSRIKNPQNGKYYGHYIDSNGEVQEARPILTMSRTDWELFKEHYTVYDLEILDGCYFNTTRGCFDEYINKWADIKKANTGGMRQIAKLFLNNLYGKFSTSDDSSFKIPKLNEDGSVSYDGVIEHDKNPGYIAVGAAITSYARAFTIRAAQANYHKGAPGFVYADTDSIHCDCQPEDLKGIHFDPVELNHWKLESRWDLGYFVRPKSYIEKIEGDWNIKCAGMPDNCKELVRESLSGDFPDFEDCTEDEKEFLYDENKQPKPMQIQDFKIGLTVPGKLMPQHIPGGIVLTKVDYTMRRIVL